MHKSRLGTVIIDCQTDDLESEANFWRAALGGAISSPSPGGRYIDLNADPSDPQLIMQRVEHPSRIHIDIETDDIEAEVRRLQDLGATVVEKMERWTVMEALSPHISSISYSAIAPALLYLLHPCSRASPESAL